MPLYTNTGILLLTGYTRVVIGGRGPYVEFINTDIVFSNIHIPTNQKYRFNNPNVYYLEYRSNDASNVKIYYQLKTVNYADYRINYGYISPFDLYLQEQIPVIEKLR